MRTTKDGERYLAEFGFALVGAGEPGCPTPGKIADKLALIYSAIGWAEQFNHPPIYLEALADLRKLRVALDTWDQWAKERIQA